MAAAPEAIALIRASNRKLKGDLRKSRRMFDRSFKKTGKNIKSSLRGALAPLGVAVGVAGIAAIGRQVLDFEQTLSDLEIQAELSGDKMGELRDTIGELSITNAQSRKSLAAASLALVNLQGAGGASAEKLKVLSDAALATSTPVEQLAGLIFSLENAFGLADPEDLRKGLDAIITAGKKGAIPLGEMNQILQSAGVTFARFSATGVDGAADLAAALQILRAGFGDATQAGTGLESLLGILETRELQLGKAGVKVRDQAGNLKPLLTLVEEISKAGIIGDPKKFNAAFGQRKEARKALILLSETTDEVRALSDAAKGSDAINRDVAKRRETDAFRIKKAFNDMTEAIAKAFTPERIAKFASVMERMADILEVLIDNAEIFIAVWAAFKIGGLVTGFAAMAGSMAASAASSSLTLGSLGKMAGPIAAAAAAGFLLGKALDDALGISDAISDAFVETEARAIRIETGLLVSQAEKLGFETRAKEALAAPQGKTALGRREQLAAAGIIRSAREAGIIGPEGEIEPEAAFRVTERRAPTLFEEPAVEAGRALPAATQELIESIKFAQQVQARTQIDVSVTVDQQGMLRAQETEESKARRSTQ